jgi:hypothetical protein
MRTKPMKKCNTLEGLYFLALSVTALATLSACQTVKYDPIKSVVLQEGLQRQVKVLGAGEWRETGVIVQTAKTYEISATGNWSMGGICGTTDASGAGVGLLCAGDPWGLGATGSTLIGRIGISGKPFRVGDNFSLKPKNEGILYLRSYDLIPFDNTGAITVTITRRGTAIASAKPKPPKKFAPIITSPRTPSKLEPSPFSSDPMAITYSQSPSLPNDIAVIIGNADYKKQGKDIPNVAPAYADAEGIKQYFMKAKGVREGNIIHLKDATSAQLTGVFGNKENHKGQLFNWTKPGVSNIYVYYAGHGAPAGDEGSAYLVPSDATSATVELTGYPLATLYKNLGNIPAKSVTVILEACFSGTSQAGSLIPNSSGITVVPKVPMVPKNITVISAGAANQIASWDKSKSHSLFTKYFLMGMSGEGDKKPYGNGDGKVTHKELGKYLEGTMTYFARRYYGRDQKAQIVSGG